MRKDMHRVLTERPRVGGWGKSKKDKFERHYDRSNGEDDSPKRMGIRKVHKACGNEKSFADLIGPLYRLIESNIGRKWDKVYSEIARGLNSRSTVHRHLLDHVEWIVATKTYVGADNKLWEAVKGSSPSKLADTSDGTVFVDSYRFRYRKYFVDSDGILRKIKFIKLAPKPKKKHFIKVDAMHYYIRNEKEIWFHVEFDKLPETPILKSIMESKWDESPFNWKSDGLCSLKHTMRLDGRVIKCWRSASSREIKKFKLNDGERS